MPPKKRTHSKTDVTADTAPPTSKDQKRGAQAQEDKGEDAASESGASDKAEDVNYNDEDWICMDQPYWDLVRTQAGQSEEEAEDDDDDEDDDDAHDPSNLRAKYQKEVIEPDLARNPASDHPDHKWKCMWLAWKTLCELKIQKDYCNPDYFDMYIYNDFESYGVMALVEKTLAEFNKEYAKKPSSPEPSSVRRMWVSLEALGHWFQTQSYEAIMQTISVDDGDRANELVELIGTAFLTGLDALERMGWLKPDSEILDLAVMMCIYLDWSRGMPDYGIGEDSEWRKNIVAYAKRAGIDFEKDGIADAEKLFTNLDSVTALKGPAKAGRWHWPKKFKEYKASYGINGSGYTAYGLPGYDITKWPRSLRAKWAFDKKDPLADILEKDLRENKIMIGGA